MSEFSLSRGLSTIFYKLNTNHTSKNLSLFLAVFFFCDMYYKSPYYCEECPFILHNVGNCPDVLMVVFKIEQYLRSMHYL